MAEIELSKPQREQAIASIQRYMEENFGEPIGNLAAGNLLNYFLEEVAPVVYNQAISDAQSRLTQRIADLSGELFAEEFLYWPHQAKRKARR